MTTATLLRLITRFLRAAGWRSWGFVALILLPVAGGVSVAAAAQVHATGAAERAQVITGGHDMAIAIGERPSPRDPSSLVTPRGRYVTTMLDVGVVPVAGTDAGLDAPYLETEWAKLSTDLIYRVTAGVLPSRRGDVAVSAQLAAGLGIRVGSSVHLGLDGGHAIRVAGIFVPRRDTTSSVVLGAPGTWGSLRIPETVRGSVFPFRTVYLDHGPGSAPRASSPQTSVTFRSTLPDSDPFYLRQPLLLIAPFVLFLAIAVSGGFLLMLRRLQPDLTVLFSLGLSRRQLRGLLIALTGAAALIGSLLGVAAGVLMSGWVSDRLGSLLEREATAAAQLSIVTIALVVALVLAAAAATALLMSRMVISGVQQGFGARPNEDGVPTRGRRTPVRRSAQAVAALAAVAALIFLRDGLPGATVTLAGSIGFLVLSVPDLLRLTAFAASRTRSRWLTLSTVLAARDGVRSATISALVLACVCIPIGLISSAQSAFDAKLLTRERAVPAGQIRLNTHAQVLDDTAITALSRAAGSPLRAKVCATAQKAGYCLVVPASGGQRLIVVVAPTIEDIETVTTYHPTAADRTALMKGSLLTFNATTRGAKVSLLDAKDRQVLSMAATAATAPVPRGQNNVGGVVLASSPALAGTGLQLQDYRVIASADRVEPLRSAGIAHGVPGNSILIDRPPTEALTGYSAFAASAAIILAALAAVSSIVLGLADRRRTADQFGALGMRTLTAKLVGGTSVSGPVAMGVLLGVVTGVLVAWLRLLGRPTPLSVPSGLLWGCLGAAVLLAALSVVTSPSPRPDRLQQNMRR